MVTTKRRLRSAQVQDGVRSAGRVSLSLLLVAALAVAVLWVLGFLWVAVWPIVLALLLSTMLWPATGFLRRHRWPPALAATATTLAFLVIAAAVTAVIAVPVGAQAVQVADGVTGSLQALRRWLEGPPLNLRREDLNVAIDTVTGQLQNSASSIAGIVVAGVGTAVSGAVTAVLTVLLLFYFLKDGPGFLPWLEAQLPGRAAVHLPVLAARSYAVLGSFVRSQALVGVLDAFFIGLGLLVVGVPLVLPLTVLTFVAAFVPIVGAFVAGGVAVAVAFFSNGLSDAVIVLVIIVVVQQLEGNLFQPVVQGKGLGLHPAVILLAVVTGGQVAGVVGALLAVPVAAVTAVAWGYLREQADPDADLHGSDPPASPGGPG